jgi:hypothetical protein
MILIGNTPTKNIKLLFIRDDGSVGSLTGEAIKRLYQVSLKDFQMELTQIYGNLSAKNIANFHSEFAKFKYIHGQDDLKAGESAIKKISYGTERVLRGYHDFTLRYPSKFELRKKVRIMEKRLEDGMTLNEAASILIACNRAPQIQGDAIEFVAPGLPEHVDVEVKGKYKPA